MLRGVRERLARRRIRRNEQPSPIPIGPADFAAPATPVSAASVSATRSPTVLNDRSAVLPAARKLLEPPPPNVVHAPAIPDPTIPSQPSPISKGHQAQLRALPSYHIPSTTKHQSVDDDNGPKQPRIFRNRSLDSANRYQRPFLGLFTGKALRSLQRGRATPERSRSSRDRPLAPPAADEKKVPDPSNDNFRQRNEDSFSSLPSTHASRDPFLNDDVPIELSRLEEREDRPRVNPGRRDGDDTFNRNSAGQFESPGRSNTDQSPPASMSSTSTSRKRSSLWKRTYDPENEFQSSHEHQILKAISLSESAVKERSVSAAQQLSRIVNQQIFELDAVISDVEKRVEYARQVSANLPLTRDGQFETLLYTSNYAASQELMSRRAEAERVFLELQWTERVWDTEAMLAEKRFEDCVTNIERLRDDGITTSASPRTQIKYQNAVQQLATEMTASCTEGGSEAAGIFAPLLARIGKADHARQVVLNSAEAELMSELHTLTAPGNDLTPRTVGVMLNKALEIFKQTYEVYLRISPGGPQNSSFFLAWVVEQSDNVYSKFVSPALATMRKAEPVAILAAIEAARHRKANPDINGQRDGESLAALLETRMTTHIRKELDCLIRDAERQLVERARVYASALPRNWREGPYQSGRAICDELNVLAKGLEGALMNLGTDTDILTGNLLVRLALEYSTSLLGVATKAVSENETLTTTTVQEGVLETFSLIGKTILRLHQKYAKIPSLERVATVLTSQDLGEIRMLQGEISAKRAPSPGVALSSPYIVKRSAGTSKLLYSNAGTNPVHRPGGHHSPTTNQSA